MKDLPFHMRFTRSVLESGGNGTFVGGGRVKTTVQHLFAERGIKLCACRLVHLGRQPCSPSPPLTFGRFGLGSQERRTFGFFLLYFQMQSAFRVNALHLVKVLKKIEIAENSLVGRQWGKSSIQKPTKQNPCKPES